MIKYLITFLLGIIFSYIIIEYIPSSVINSGACYVEDGNKFKIQVYVKINHDTEWIPYIGPIGSMPRLWLYSIIGHTKEIRCQN